MKKTFLKNLSRILAFALVLVLAAGLIGCGGPDVPPAAGDRTVIY